MFPTLLSLGPLKINTGGVILALTFFVTTFWIWKRGREEHFEEEALMDMVILVTLVGLILSRVFYVISHLNLFSSFWQVFQIIKYPGFSYPGGLAGGLLAFVLFASFKKWDFYLLADLVAPPLVFALALGRLANFFAGSYYGRETQLVIGLIFPGTETPRHPIQLYAFLLFLLFLRLLFKIEKEYRFYGWYQGRRREAAPGFVFFSFFIGTGMIELLVAFFVDGWLYWKGIPLIFILPLVEIFAGGGGIYLRSGMSLKAELVVFARAREALSRFKQGRGAQRKPRFEFKSKKRIKVGKQV